MEFVGLISKVAAKSYIKYLESAVTNSKSFRDLKDLLVKDNFEISVKNMFKASITDAKAITQLSNNLTKELIEDHRNREELFSWITYGTPPLSEVKKKLNLEPYMERYSGESEKIPLFFLVFIEKIEEYKLKNWEASDLEIISKLGRIEHQLDEIHSLQKDSQISSKNLENMVKEMMNKKTSTGVLFNREIEDLLFDNNITAAEKQITNALKSVINTGSMDPDWTNEIIIDNNEAIILKKPRNQEVLTGLEMRLEVLIKIPKEYQHFKNFVDLIQYGTLKQTPLEFEIETFEHFAGENKIGKQTSGPNKSLSLIVNPIPFPVLQCRLMIDKICIDENVKIQIVEVISDTEIRISNKNQNDRMLEYDFFYSTTNPINQFNLKIPLFRGNCVKSHLMYLNFFRIAQQKREMELVTIEDEEGVFSAYFTDEQNIYTNSKRMYNILSMLSDIEDYLEEKFFFSDVFSDEDVFYIEYLKKVISLENLEEDIDFQEFSAKYDTLEKLEETIGKENNIRGEGHLEFTLLNIRIRISIEVVYPPLSIKNVEKVQKKLEVLEEGDQISVVMTSGNQEDKTKVRYRIEALTSK